MPDCEPPTIVSGIRRGPLIILTDIEGRRLAVRDHVIRAVDEAAADGSCRLLLSSGEKLLADADLETVLGWLTDPVRQR